MTVFKEENKNKRIRPNREVIIYSLLIIGSLTIFAKRKISEFILILGNS